MKFNWPGAQNDFLATLTRRSAACELVSKKAFKSWYTVTKPGATVNVGHFLVVLILLKLWQKDDYEERLK